MIVFIIIMICSHHMVVFIVIVTYSYFHFLMGRLKDNFYNYSNFE
jgi:hypothetical protein